MAMSETAVLCHLQEQFSFGHLLATFGRLFTRGQDAESLQSDKYAACSGYWLIPAPSAIYR